MRTGWKCTEQINNWNITSPKLDRSVLVSIKCYHKQLPEEVEKDIQLLAKNQKYKTKCFIDRNLNTLTIEVYTKYNIDVPFDQKVNISMGIRNNIDKIVNNYR